MAKIPNTLGIPAYAPAEAWSAAICRSQVDPDLIAQEIIQITPQSLSQLLEAYADLADARAARRLALKTAELAALDDEPMEIRG